MTLSIALITHNEEENIEACLESVRWADEIIVVDDGSKDATVKLAQKFTSRIYTEPFRNFAAQKNSAMQHASGDWIFFIDADERVSPELAREIQQISRGPKDHVYSVKRHTYFFGRPLHYSGTQEDYPVRLFPRGHAVYEQPVHETIVSRLPVKALPQPLIHYSTKNLAHYRRKLDQYVSFELQVMKSRPRAPWITDIALRPAARFFQLYFWNLGILDGIPGLQYAALSAYYAFLKHWRYFFDSSPAAADAKRAAV